MELTLSIVSFAPFDFCLLAIRLLLRKVRRSLLRLLLPLLGIRCSLLGPRTSASEEILGRVEIFLVLLGGPSMCVFRDSARCLCSV